MNYLSMQRLDKIHELYEYNLPMNTIHKIHEISGPDKNSDNSWILWIEVALKKNSWNSWISWKISGGNSWVSGGNSWVSGGNARQLFLALDLYSLYMFGGIQLVSRVFSSQSLMDGESLISSQKFDGDMTEEALLQELKMLEDGDIPTIDVSKGHCQTTIWYLWYCLKVYQQ